MLTIRTTLQPNGQVQLPRTFVHDKPVPVLVTFLEPQPEPGEESGGLAAFGARKGSAAATLALLQTPEFRALPQADPQEVERRIQELRGDWESD